MRRSTCYFIVYFLLHATSLVAQEPLFRKYTQENGLPSLTIYSITQDKKGFLWLCTGNGVCRFDGRHIKNFTPQNSPADYGAFRLLLDSKERLWVTSIFSAPIYYKDGEFHTLNYPSGSAIIGTRAIAEDSKGNIFFFTTKGNILQYKTDSTCNEVYTSVCSWHDVVFLNDTLIYGNDGTNVWRISNFKKKEPVLVEKYTHGESVRFYNIRSGTMILSAAKGLYKITANDQKLIWEWPARDAHESYCMHAENDSVYWLGTRNGLYIFLCKSDKLLLQKKLLDDKYITYIQKDNNGNYWIHSYNDALYFLNSANTCNYNLPEQKNNILKILFIRDKGYAFNTRGDYFEIRNNTISLKGNFFSTAKDNIYLKAMMFSENEIFIHFKKAEGFLTEHAYTLQKTGWALGFPNYYYRPDGTFFTCGSDSSGNTVVRSIGKKNLQLQLSIPGHILSKNFCVDLNDRCWAGYNDTMYCIWYNNEHKLIVDKYFEKNVFISDIACDSRNNIWVATKGGGVYCLKDKKKIASYTVANGLLTNDCSSLYPDDSNNIWVCTEKGLNEILPGSSSGHVRSFTKDDLLPDNGVNTVYKKGNIVYVGTCKGLISFKNNEAITTTSFPISAYITNVAIRGKDTTIQNSYTINYGNSIGIGFSTIAFNNNQPPTYYYKLDGVDADWNTTTVEKMQYEHLNPGTYTFRVYTGSWLNKGAELKIIVLAPFWAKWWFICLEIFGTLLFISGVFYLVIYFKNRKTELQRRMIENDLRSLRAQINPHFIFNALNSIQDFILKQEPRSANYYLTQFAKLMRMIVDNSKKEYINLTDEFDFLHLYLELEQLRLGSSFSFEIIYEKSLVPANISLPPMIIQPIVENCIRHGLPGKQGEKKLQVYFQQQGNLLHCTVSDNGVGRAYAAQQRNVTQKVSMGIDNITERLQLMCKKENIQWQAIEINDLYENNTASGTKVSLFIPLTLN